MSRPLAAQLSELVNQISTIIVGKRPQIEDCVACLLAGGLYSLYRDAARRKHPR